MLAQINAARATNSFERQFAKLAGIDLLIIDDFGLKPLTGIQDEDFHEVISERYERKSTIVTSNLDIPEWPDAFPNRILGAATIDRLQRNRLTESSLPGLAFGVSLPTVGYFHNREAANDDRGTKRPLAGHHRQAGGERSERGGVLPGGTHPRGSFLFLASQVQ